MFYKMITDARDRWFMSPNCTIRERIDYMEHTRQMRDAQIDAIKTYLYLKIVGASQPLDTLFIAGIFNHLDLDAVALSVNARAWLNEHPEAVALLQYAMSRDDSGQQISKKLEEQMRTHPEQVDCRRFFHDAFYGVSYTDYLFSLPMGAGKTYLMAAFIYLDLYYAQNEPDNPAFAHNFMIFAPSGLKSSVIPSLKTIQNFDPSWVIPEPAASQIKKSLKFEILDQQKTPKGVTKIKNPNAQKIARYLDDKKNKKDNEDDKFNQLFGLVAVTNAEKVILDRIAGDENQERIKDFENTEDDRERQANELRNLIGKLPALSIFIDEVHHAVSNADKNQERKLRGVVNGWAKKGSVNSVIGFSGTPYLEKNEKIRVTPELTISTAEIANIVYYYPLIDGVGNFLKRPVLYIDDMADSQKIIEQGVRAFLDAYLDTKYANGVTAKLGIYCGTIGKLEEQVYPIVIEIARQYHLNEDAVLKFHRGNKKYPVGAENQTRFDTLDQLDSRVRIVLLVQIGKEGWDCRSLTGVILSQEGDCPRNMVLQTACRCLRQADRGQPETALIELNRFNADKLREQLQKQHHATLDEFTRGVQPMTTLKRYDRTEFLKLPRMPAYQLSVRFESFTTETACPEKSIPQAADMYNPDQKSVSVLEKWINNQTLSTSVEDKSGNTKAYFFRWLCHIVKESFGTLSLDMLKPYENELRDVFDKIIYERDGAFYFNESYNRVMIEANIRKAFCDKRVSQSKEEIIRQDASLLKIENFQPEFSVSNPNDYYPDQEISAKVVWQDEHGIETDEKAAQFIRMAEELGKADILEAVRRQYGFAVTNQNRSFHYLPYRMDSDLERDFLPAILPADYIVNYGLEVYYNGDSGMTEFQIACHKRGPYGWRYIGHYTPDFLMIQRRDGKIYKVLIVETKGKIYANDPTFQAKREFTETEFLALNEQQFGYRRFEYLYLEDRLSEKERLELTRRKIIDFFERV